ncbi:hypothetical protein L1049_027895 [Liquidambar formosana]|uniref:Wall-associated receptor kinase galacturonan-binding domain-containing protein n=1 Tax=Liquidambar formosana TaxID=63359 RepID=A0AAP0RJY9_LIQFO
MTLGLLLQLICTLWLVKPSAAAAPSLAKLGCEDICGNVRIPYPFGMGGKSNYHDECQGGGVRRIVGHKRSDSRQSDRFQLFMAVSPGGGAETALVNCRGDVLALYPSNCAHNGAKGSTAADGCRIPSPFSLDFYSVNTTANQTVMGDCTFATLAEEDWPVDELQKADHAPVVMGWSMMKNLPDGVSAGNFTNPEPTYTCWCHFSYEGNPYIMSRSWYASNGWGHHNEVVSCVENTPRIASRVKCPWVKDPETLEEERRVGVGYFRAWLSRGLT